MATLIRRTPNSRVGGINLDDHVVEARGSWAELADARGPQLLQLREADDEVELAGPLDLNLTVYAEHETTSPSGRISSSRQPLLSHDVSVPAGQTWRYRMDHLRGLGGNAGTSAWIRATRPRLEAPVVAAVDLPCDYAVRPLADLGAFFPTPCDPCEGGPVRVPPVECGPAVDVLPASGGCVRPRYFNGMFITREDLETEQRYLRMKLRLQNRASGTGVVWGLPVALRGEHVVVGPGYGVDCCGNDLALTCDYSVAAASLLRDPAVCGSDRECFALLLEYVECPEEPRPVHGDGCEPRRAGCEMSRIRETVRLRLVPPTVTPQTPLGRFVQRIDDLVDLGAERPVPEVPVAGTALVPAPDSIPVPFSVTITLGVARLLQPSRTDVVTDGFDMRQNAGVVSLRVSPANTAQGLSGTVRRDGTVVVGLDASGGFWTFPFRTDRDGDRTVTYTIDWSTAFPDRLRGTTVVHLTIRGGDRVAGEFDLETDTIAFWPEPHGLAPGDQVTVVFADGRSVEATVLAVDGTRVELDGPLGGGERATDVFFLQPARLDVRIEPTRVLMETAPVSTLCCGVGCCDEHERLRIQDRLRALLAALLYGRLVQRRATLPAEAGGTRVLAALREFLRMPSQRLPEFEDAVADLYRAWCGAALYPGPAHCDPDGVVIGCAHVRAGALCDVDPLDGRRWVVHQPLLDHWAGRFGLDPLDRRVGELFQRLCCLSHLPGFGTLVEAGLPPDDAETSPTLSRFLFGSHAGAVTPAFVGTAAAGSDLTAALGGLARFGDLDLLGISGLVEELLCERPRISADVLSQPERTRLFVAEAFADLPTREQPGQALRETARSIARAVLAAVPASVAVGEDNPLAHVFESIEVRSLDDVLAIPADVVAELSAAAASAEQVDEGVERATATARRVVETVAESLRAMREHGLTDPESLEDEALARRLATEITGRLERESIELDPDEIAEGLRARRQ